MTLEQYLCRNGITLGELLDRASQQLDIEDDDELFVSGSLVEEIGNPQSDIDLFILRERDEVARALPQIVFIESIAIDIEICAVPSLRRLLDKVHHLIPLAIDDPRHALSVSPTDFGLLHKVSTGRPLIGGERLRECQKAIIDARPNTLAFVRALSMINTVQLDLAGAVEAGDRNMADFLGQRLAGLAFDALLATAGNCCPQDKWRFARLDRLNSEIACQVFDPLEYRSARSALSDALDPHRWDNYVQYATSVVQLCNFIIPFCQGIWMGSRNMLGGIDRAHFMRPSRPPDNSSVLILPQISLVTQVRAHKGRLQISNLNRPLTLEINCLAFAVVLMCDGLTTLNQAQTALARHSDPELTTQLASCIQDLVALLKHNKFVTGADS